MKIKQKDWKKLKKQLYDLRDMIDASSQDKRDMRKLLELFLAEPDNPKLHEFTKHFLKEK